MTAPRPLDPAALPAEEVLARTLYYCPGNSSRAATNFQDSNTKLFGCGSAALGGEALAGRLADPANGATHYVNASLASPPWARGQTPSAVIGRHTFFRIG